MKFLLCFLLLVSNIYAGLEETLNSCCRIATHEIVNGKTVTSRGSGVFFKETDKYYYILTAGHVVKDYLNPRIGLMINGDYYGPYKTKCIFAKIPTDLYDEDTKYETIDVLDCAVLQIDKTTLEVKPTVLELSTELPSINEVCITGGHPYGTYTRVGQVKIVDVQKNYIEFKESCMMGDSGGPLTLNDKIVGLTNLTNNKFYKEERGRGISSVAILNLIKDVKFE